MGDKMRTFTLTDSRSEIHGVPDEHIHVTATADIVADLRREAGELPRSLMTGEQAAASRALRAYADKLERLMQGGDDDK